MVNYIYLASATTCIAMTGIWGAYYNRKNTGKGDSALYSFLQLCSVFLGWLVLWLMNFSFNIKVLPYSLLFSVGYTLAMVGMIKAMETGSVALTSLIMQLSLIGATIWGFFFWDSAVTELVVIGLVLVVVALTLCLYDGKEEKTVKKDKRWFIYVSLMFVGNACGTIVQKDQQIRFAGEYGNQMMCMATLFAFVFCAVRFWRSEKGEVKKVLKTSLQYPVLSGLSNVSSNFFVILLAVSPLSPSLVYPVLSVGGLMITMLFSLFVFQEKMRWWQWLGIAIGSLSVALLSI